MPVRNYTNISTEGQLSGAIGTGDTTIALSGAGLTSIPAPPFYVRIDPDTAQEELVLVGAGSSATSLLNCTRGYDGTSAFSHNAGAKVRHCVAAEFYNKADTHTEGTTNVHGLSGGSAVAGTTQTQTLTNKTINASVIDLAHSTSPSASQAYRAHADAVTGRDGFVWDNTAGSSGRAFVALSGGVVRFRVDGVGGLMLNSPTANDKVLSVQNSLAERFFMQADGHADFTMQSGGATTDRVRIHTQTTQNALAVKDGADVDLLTISGTGGITATTSITTTAGNMSAGGSVTAGTSIAAGTSATVGTDLTVSGATSLGSFTASGTGAITGALTQTGASSFTGDSTWVLPASGTTPRLTIHGRTGSRLIEGHDQAAVTTFHVKETGEFVSAAKAFIHNNSSPVVALVNATSDVPSPTSAMVVYDNSDKLVKQYDGSTWVVKDYFGINNYVRYRRGTDQSITHNTNTKINFTTADVTDTAIVTVASGTDFTLVRAGLYLIECNVQHEADVNGSRWLFIADAANQANRYAVDTNNPNNGAATAQQVVCLRRFTAGTVISAWVYQDSGVTNPLTGSLPSLCPMHINFTWLGP
jgi:hypothetical protein